MARGWLKGLGIAAACVGASSVAGGLLYAATRTAPCDRTELTASIGGDQPSPPHASALDRMTIVLVGDTGFNPTDAKVEAERRAQRQEAHELLRHACRDLQRGRRRSRLHQSRDRRHRPQRPRAGRQGQGRVSFPQSPGRAEGADRCRLQSVLARQQSFLRLRPARHRGDALPSRRGQCREGHRLCRHRQQFRRGDPARLHRPRRHAHRLFRDRHHDRRSAAISRRPEQARARPPTATAPTSRRPWTSSPPCRPTTASSPSITGSKAASCPTSASSPIGAASPPARRTSISSSATTRMWSKASSSTASR